MPKRYAFILWWDFWWVGHINAVHIMIPFAKDTILCSNLHNFLLLSYKPNAKKTTQNYLFSQWLIQLVNCRWDMWLTDWADKYLTMSPNIIIDSHVKSTKLFSMVKFKWCTLMSLFNEHKMSRVTCICLWMPFDKLNINLRIFNFSISNKNERII